MRLTLSAFLVLISACTSVPKREPAQAAGPALTNAEIENFAQATALILRPRLFRLDRTAITFYYEEMPTVGEIHSLDEATARLLTKPDRFGGQRTGLYSEADPKGSRSFGKAHPRLFVLEVQPGTLFFNDIHPNTVERARLIAALHLDPGAYQEYSAIHYIGNMHVEDAAIFKIENRVTELLGTGNRLYHFNEAEQKNCRYNGTDIALALKDPETFKVIAYYSDAESVESSPMAANVKRLFDETSFLNDTNVAPVPSQILQRATEVPISPVNYQRWKNRFILTCGTRWAFE